MTSRWVVLNLLFPSIRDDLSTPPYSEKINSKAEITFIQLWW